MGSMTSFFRPRILTRAEQRLYDVERLNLKPQGPVEPLHAVSVREIWFEEVISTDWIAACRLVLQDNETRIVIAELRVFPSHGPREVGSGRWDSTPG